VNAILPCERTVDKGEEPLDTVSDSIVLLARFQGEYGRSQRSVEAPHGTGCGRSSVRSAETGFVVRFKAWLSGFCRGHIDREIGILANI